MGNPDVEADMRMLVNSGPDDGEPNLRPGLSVKDDAPADAGQAT